MLWRPQQPQNLGREIRSDLGSVAQPGDRAQEEFTTALRHLTCGEKSELWGKAALGEAGAIAGIPRVPPMPHVLLISCEDKTFAVLIITGNFSAGKKENPCPEEAESQVLIYSVINTWGYLANFLFPKRWTVNSQVQTDSSET